MITPEQPNNPPIRCECNQWSGEPCNGEGAKQSMVIMEYMPDCMRASHEAAGNRGIHPLNGSERLTVTPECAARMLEHDGDWCRVIDQQTTSQ